MSEHGHYSEQEFEELVRSALDELPTEFQRALENVAIVVSDRGAEHHAYGEYVGTKMHGRSYFGGGGLPDEILIFRDTLVRDFGADPERLRSPGRAYGASRGWPLLRLRRGWRSPARPLTGSGTVSGVAKCANFAPFAWREVKVDSVVLSWLGW